jgi:hypothetical protein
LGAALVETGAAARGSSLLARAFELASERHQASGSILLDLARALAERLGDLPAAIARVRGIPREAPEAILARGLEGRWRAQVGDLAGASLAFATLRDMASSLAVEHSLDDATAAAESGRRTEEIAKLLIEGAELEGAGRHDRLAAEGHRAEALRLRHSVDSEWSERAGLTQEPEARLGGLDRWNLDPEASGSDESPEQASRVEDLTRRFQANPDDQAVATELSSLLESLGRSHELLALLSARLDDAAPDERTALVPRVRAALERLAAGAEAAGRTGEASLYRSALDALSEPAPDP